MDEKTSNKIERTYVEQYQPTANIASSPYDVACKTNLDFAFTTPSGTYLDLYKSSVVFDINITSDGSTQLVDASRYSPANNAISNMFKFSEIIINGKSVSRSSNVAQDDMFMKSILNSVSYNVTNHMDSFFEYNIASRQNMISSDAVPDYLTGAKFYGATQGGERTAKMKPSCLGVFNEKGLLIPPNSSVVIKFELDSKYKRRFFQTDAVTATDIVEGIDYELAISNDLIFRAFYVVSSMKIPKKMRYNNVISQFRALSATSENRLSVDVPANTIKIGIALQSSHVNSVDTAPTGGLLHTFSPSDFQINERGATGEYDKIKAITVNYAGGTYPKYPYKMKSAGPNIIQMTSAYNDFVLASNAADDESGFMSYERWAASRIYLWDIIKPKDDQSVRVAIEVSATSALAAGHNIFIFAITDETTDF